MFNSYKPKTTKTYTTNYNGGTATKVDPTTELTLSVLSGFLDVDSFYESNADKVDRINGLLSRVNDNYIFKLAVAARNEFKLREAPVVLIALQTLRGKIIPKNVIYKVFVRGDEVTEYISAVKALSNKGTITKEASRVANTVLNSLTERQALRYMGGSKSWSLADVIRVTHPKPVNEKQSTLLQYILRKDRDGSHTKAWESLSDKGKELLPFIKSSVTEDDGSVSWERSVSAGASWDSVVRKMGYMALLRNLRNFLKDTTFTEWDYVISVLTDKNEVLKSKQLPFRFYSAYREVSAASNTDWTTLTKVKRALEIALEHSVANASQLEGKTLYVIDNSSSMTFGEVSKMSSLTYATVANVLGVIGAMISNADVVTFSSNAKKVDLKGMSALQAIEYLEDNIAGGGTVINSVTKVVNIHDYDNIVILSDMQLSDNLETTGFSKFTGNIFSVNLAGYSANSDFSRTSKNVRCFSGWSDTIFEIMKAETKGGIVNYINSISLI